MKATVKTNTASRYPETFTFDVPEMVGSEKQIAWAEIIFIDVISGLCSMVSGKTHNENIKSQYDMILSKLSTQTSAKFWIDNKGSNFQTIYKSL